MVVINRRDQVAGSDSALFLAVQQQSCSSQKIQPSTWRRIASLHLAEPLRQTALPHGSALHLEITCKLLLCVRLGVSRDRGCGHHAVETPLHDCTAVRVPKYHSVRNVKKVFIVILVPKLPLNFVVALAAGVKPSSREGLLEDGKSEACCRTQETRPGAWSSRVQTDARA